MPNSRAFESVFPKLSILFAAGFFPAVSSPEEDFRVRVLLALDVLDPVLAREPVLALRRTDEVVRLPDIAATRVGVDDN